MQIKSRIGVKLNVEALHCWKDINVETMKDVAYLQHPHRHTFVIECWKNVNHDNRDTEFIQFKHLIEDWITAQHWSDEYKMVNFQSMSCEMIARKLYHQFNLYKCIVSEDNEFFAEVYCDKK